MVGRGRPSSQSKETALGSSRSSQGFHAQEDFTFDNIAKGDLNEMWQIGPNQAGNFGSGRQSATEANVVESTSRPESAENEPR